MKRGVGIVAGVLLLGVAGAPAASAADTFADASIGRDGNACTTAAAPCATIAAAIAKSGAGDTIRVAPGIYAEQLTLGGGRSLRATGTPASTVVASGASPTLDVTSAAGTVEGFTIRGTGGDPDGALRLHAAATIRGNVFDGDDDGGAATARPAGVRITAGSPTVTENTFTDDREGNQVAISSASTGAPTITENRINGFFTGIAARAGTPEIRSNVITATHNSSTIATGTSIGVFDDPDVNTTAFVTANYIHSPVDNGSGLPIGISVMDPISGPGSTTVAAALRRNQIHGGSFGIDIFGTSPATTLDSDVIAGTTIFGLKASETAAGTGDVVATNITVASNAFDVTIGDVQLTLNSSILEDPIHATGSAGCTITFSRLSSTATPTAPSCDDAATTAAPAFVDAAALDFHLLGFPENNALNSGGDPADPPVDARDFDGDLRELPPNGTSAPNREIGADELLPGGYSPAETAIDAGPGSSGTASKTGAFSFSSSPAGATFECSLDGRAFSACTAPKSYSGLGGGTHTFRVRSTSPVLQGSTDPTPATRTFTVDATPPQTQINAGPPPGGTTGGSPEFAFGSEPGARLECSLDRTPFSRCGPNQTFSGLTGGAHRLVVRAVDGVGNADPTAASRTWNVDVTPPETTIDSGPADGATTDSRSGRYAFSSEPGATFECSADGGAFAPCTSPATVADLAVGPHTFAVRATDAVGNTDQTPAQRSLTVVQATGADDDDPPETKVRKVRVKDDDAKVRFSSDEPGSTFRCKLDRKKFKRCTSPRRAKNLDDGRHRFKVRAIDAAGNVDPTPAKKRFEID